MLALADEQRYSGTYEAVRRTAEEAKPTRVPWRVIVLLALVAAIGLTFVWLRSGIQQVSRELQIQQRKMVLRTEELDNLRIQVEAYRSGDYILAECRKLGLHPPLPGQVRRMPAEDRVTPTADAEPPALASSEGDDLPSRRTP